MLPGTLFSSGGNSRFTDKPQSADCGRSGGAARLDANRELQIELMKKPLFDVDPEKGNQCPHPHYGWRLR